MEQVVLNISPRQADVVKDALLGMVTEFEAHIDRGLLSSDILEGLENDLSDIDTILIKLGKLEDKLCTSSV